MDEGKTEKPSILSKLVNLPTNIDAFNKQLPDRLNQLAEKALAGQIEMMEGAFDEIKIGLGLIDGRRDRDFVVFVARSLSAAASVFQVRRNLIYMTGTRTIPIGNLGDEASRGLMNIIDKTVASRFQESSLTPKPADEPDMYRRELCLVGAETFLGDAGSQRGEGKNWLFDAARGVLEKGAENIQGVRPIISQIEAQLALTEPDKQKLAALEERYVNGR